MRRSTALVTGLALLTAPVAGWGRTSPRHQIESRHAEPRTDPVTTLCKGRVQLGCRAATWVAADTATPQFAVAPAPPPTETLAQALDAAYHTAPSLQAQRYQLRATDENYALALSELRPTTQLQISGSYDKTVPGRTTQATRFLAPSPIVTSNTLSAQASVTQPLYTGGRASADRDAALAEVGAGRALLRSTEGALLLQVITAYTDVRRDAEALRLYRANLGQLEATLDEVKARRTAGELTRTDIAQAETQLNLARGQHNLAVQQLEQDRATYAALTGHDPGELATPPELPGVPVTVGAALDLAGETSPDLDQAVLTERQSRAQIAVAKSQGRPVLTLNGSATLSGQATPYYLHNEDQGFRGGAVLTIPLTNGGRVGALVAQAEDRDAASRLGIETTRRQMVDNIVNAWNAIATAQRNIAVDSAGLDAARVFDDGTFQEYRAGLRSTFDVLFAHSTLLNAQVTLVGAQRDLYVAQATLLRHVGLLEARLLLTDPGLYNPDADFRHAARRGALPLAPVIHAIDRIAMPGTTAPPLQQPPAGSSPPVVATAAAPATAAPVAIAQHSPENPLPGTTATANTPTKPHHRRRSRQP
ncbi:TolC family protein [Novosphingobium sp.]|uniref:TolC family protein n=1 Tax=Novosphingobium sp. TaxID=1874826 RepID=UPI00333E8B16